MTPSEKNALRSKLSAWSSQTLCSQKAFRRCVNDILGSFEEQPAPKLSSEALLCLQMASEEYVVSFLNRAWALTAHAKKEDADAV